MSDSILNSIKKVLNLSEDDTTFDADVLMHINSTFSTLKQLGVGPEEGFAIEDAVPTWDAFFGDNLSFNFIKSYVYLRVRFLFDPPQTSYLIQAMKEERQEFEHRILTERERTEWVNPNPAPVDEISVIDGGEP